MWSALWLTTVSQVVVVVVRVKQKAGSDHCYTRGTNASALLWLALTPGKRQARIINFILPSCDAKENWRVSFPEGLDGRSWSSEAFPYTAYWWKLTLGGDRDSANHWPCPGGDPEPCLLWAENRTSTPPTLPCKFRFWVRFFQRGRRSRPLSFARLENWGWMDCLLLPKGKASVAPSLPPVSDMQTPREFRPPSLTSIFM